MVINIFYLNKKNKNIINFKYSIQIRNLKNKLKYVSSN